MCEVAKRMGFGAAFPYSAPAEIFAEHAALSGFENHSRRAFDLSGLSKLSRKEYDALAPIQWPVPSNQPQGTTRLFANGRFFTPSGRARFVPVLPRSPHNPTCQEYPFVLNTGRVRDHWHTMTRTGQSARLSNHIAEPYAELHPQDAVHLGIADNSLVQLSTRWGNMLVRARVNDGQRVGSVFTPIHWNGQFASRGRVGALVNPVADPVSGQPESKHTPVRIEPYRAAWYGFALTPQSLACDTAYWVRALDNDVWRYALADLNVPEDWTAWARRLFNVIDRHSDWIEYRDTAAGYYRAAMFRDGRLAGCVFTAPTPELPSHTWLTGLFAKAAVDPADRAALLTGRPLHGQADCGRVVCSCFGIGERRITEAIRHHNLRTVESVSALLKAGTNCGSCLPEIRQLLERTG